ncbi:MAG TPA: glycosyltransferase family 4 protein [Mycobacteriales bacterium]|nr:glycosyltransferase family 4 protein [Mycobacteriales bacterium]
MSRVLRPAVVSVVVVQDRPGDAGLRPALDSLAGAGLPPEVVQLVVVREPGTPLPAGTTPALVAVADGPLSARRAAGATVADGQFLALVDGSTALPPGVLADLLDTLHREVRTAAVVPARTPGPRLQDALRVPLALAVLRASAWHHAVGHGGSLDDGADDLDLGWRLLLLGLRTRVRGDVVVDLPPAAEPSEEAFSRVVERCASDAVLGTSPDVPGRAHVQAARRLDDLGVLAALRRVEGDPVADRVRALLESAPGLRRRQRVLVVTGDTLGARMAGPAIRAWAVAHALAEEHDVVLAALGGCTVVSPVVDARSVGEAELRVLERWCDVVVFQGYLLRDVPWMADSAKVLVADLYDPIHLEVLEVVKGEPRERRESSAAVALEALEVQLRRADLFLCASERQRDLWIGHLAALGRVNPRTYGGDEDLEDLLKVVPFGTAEEPPVRTRPAVKGVVPGIGPDDRVLLWGGGIYNWFDPLTLVRAVGLLREERDDVRLFFLGVKHPNPAVPAMRMAAAARELSDRLGLTGTSVFFNEEWVPYDERGQYLLDADVGVTCHYPHVETRFSYRTRVLDYLWAGLPIVTTEGDAFADLVAARDLGEVVPPEDPGALAAALRSVLDPERNAACRARVREVAVDHTWSRTLQPLVEFCRAPRHAADRSRPVPDPAGMLAEPERTATSDARLLVEYLRAGGPREVVRRAGGRVRRRLAPAPE